MKITISMLLLCLCISFKLKAQSNYTVKGSIIDTALSAKLGNAAVCVLNAKDSTMQQFTRAAVNGAFTINHLKKGKLILLVTYPGYADYVEHFTLDSAKSSHDFGSISMVLKARLLQDVIIKGTAAAIKIKGDTTEFNAAAFKIQPNAKVEDLLKQLPGIQVDKDGKITAQGQTVPKVLVDGEEFFGDDPTLVTKNLRADMVDKVQLYDKKSDQAAFTGIDDGNTTKTINIKLKEDKKTGFFGKAEAAKGTDGYYQGQLMYNRFKGKQKLSVYGIGANTGKVGLGWNDANKYGVTSVEFGDNGGFIVYGGGGDDLDSFGGRYNGQGIPKALSGGVHYDNKWSNDKQSVNTNYKIGSLEVDGTSNNQVQNNLPSGIIKSNTDQGNNNSVFRQKLDVTYQIKLDTASNLKIMVDGTAKTTKTHNTYNAFSTNGNDVLLNRNMRDLNNNVDNQIVNLSAFYTHKFKKTGRTFSLNVAQSTNKSQAKGYLNSEVDFYNKTSGAVDSTQTVNQYKTNNITNSTFSTNATYTEPFSKKTSMIFNYGVGINNSNADRKSFNQSAPNVYDQFDSRYSNNYQLNQFSNQVGAIFNYQTPKTTLNFGAKVSNVDFKQVDKYSGDVYKRDFINWNPQASYKYKFSQYKGLRINYLGATVQPSIDQIQPVRVNTDPLNITIGNPDLTPSFRNSFYAGYNSYKVLTEENIYVNARMSITSNAIVNNTTTDSTGKSTYQSINLDGHAPIDYYVYTGYSRKVFPFGLNIGLGVGVNGSVYYAYINRQLNTTNSTNYNIDLSFSKYVQKKYDFRIGGGPTYNVGKSSLQPLINNNGYGFSGYEYFNFYLPGKFQIGSDGNYNYTGKTQSFDQTNSRTIINANISKTFLKQDNLKISASCNDLFNQNNGFNRYANGNTISQSQYTTIRRYFMLTVSWDFSKFGAGAQPSKSN